MYVDIDYSSNNNKHNRYMIQKIYKKKIKISIIKTYFSWIDDKVFRLAKIYDKYLYPDSRVKT